jgi:methyl-accepting chemotaxis protein
MRFRWSIPARTVAVAWAAVVVTAVSGLLIQRSVIRQQGLDLVRNAMRGIVLSAESTRTAVSSMNSRGDFDRKSLVAESRKSSDIRSTRFYDTIPVVAAWKTVEHVAGKEGYEFRTPSNNPRNPKNNPDPEEQVILTALAKTKQEEYFGVDEARNEMVYARPILLSEDCLACHGDPAGGSKDGKDVLGFRMEGWHSGEMHGAFLLRSKLDQVDSQVKAGMWKTALWLTPMSLLVGFGAFLATKQIRGPLAEAVSVLQSVAKGDLRRDLQVTNNDEIGDMAAAMRSMSASLRNMIGEIAGGVEVLASSSRKLSANSEEMAANSRHSSEKAHSVAAAAEEMSANVMSVASGMDAAVANFGNVTAATEQMTATIGEIAANSEKARRITAEATCQAAKVTEKMNRLGEAAREIGKVTEAINEISSQTNLLALNATIEAARAGSAGKGFAVVANEIKQLAHQTASATEDIKARIAGVQSSTADGIAGIEGVSRVIHEVSDLVSSIAAAIEEQSVVTKDIANNIANASNGVGDANARVSQSSQVSLEIASDIAVVDQAAGQIAGGSEEVQATVVELSKLAETLRETVSRFQV